MPSCKVGDSACRADHVIATQEATIQDLRFHLDNAEAAVPQLRSELSYVRLVCDDAWSYSYLEGLERMRNHVLLNPHSNLRALKRMTFL